MMESDWKKGLIDEEGEDDLPKRPPSNWTPSLVADSYTPSQLEHLMEQNTRERSQIRQALRKQRKRTSALDL